MSSNQSWNDTPRYPFGSRSTGRDFSKPTEEFNGINSRKKSTTDPIPSQLHSPVSRACFLPQVHPQAFSHFESNVPTSTGQRRSSSVARVVPLGEYALTRLTGNNSLHSLKSSTSTLISASHRSTRSWSSISTLSSS